MIDFLKTTWYWLRWILGITLSILGALAVAAISVFFTIILPILIIVWVWEKLSGDS